MAGRFEPLSYASAGGESSIALRDPTAINVHGRSRRRLTTDVVGAARVEKCIRIAVAVAG